MQKIVQIIDTLNPGGAERVAVDLANGLINRGYEVYFCATRQDGTLSQELNQEINFFCLNRSKSYHGLLIFRKFIKINKIGIVHAHGNSTAIFCALALMGLRNVHIIHHDHNPLLSLRNIFLQKLLLSRVGAWITVSDQIQNWVLNKIGYSRALMIKNPIQVSRFYKTPIPNGEKKVIVVLANYREQKDYENLLAAASILKSRGLKFSIKCFGSHFESEYFVKIKKLSLENDLIDYVSLNPSVTNIPELLSMADIGVLSSADEGLPISLLEYMASSLPVVVTDVGECGRIVRQAACGKVVPSNDRDSLAMAIEAILLDEKQWSIWGKNGREYILKNHSMDIFLDKVVNDVYNKL